MFLTIFLNTCPPWNVNFLVFEELVRTDPSITAGPAIVVFDGITD
jgi:hypothetical protein